MIWVTRQFWDAGSDESMWQILAKYDIVSHYGDMPDNIFPVKIIRSETVSALKEVIKDKNLHAFHNINACMYMPIGGDGWKTITALHNKWAVMNNHPEHTLKSLGASIMLYLVNTKKPTGDAEVPEHVQWAWDIEESINRKAAVLPLNDPELANVPSDENEAKADVIEISEEDGEGKGSKAPIKGGLLAKAYQVNPPLSKWACVSSATDALSAISTMFSPNVMQQHDASQMAHQLQMVQLSTYQTEIHELHS
ncbi:hypothetical protein J3A83DRAFT_4185105 [Scleroderma citrinum]